MIARAVILGAKPNGGTNGKDPIFEMKMKTIYYVLLNRDFWTYSFLNALNNKDQNIKSHSSTETNPIVLKIGAADVAL